MSSQSSKSTDHDTHALPPAFIQDTYWHYNRVKLADLDSDLSVVDFARGLSDEQKHVIRPVGSIDGSTIKDACDAFRDAAMASTGQQTPRYTDYRDVKIFEHQEFPGLQILPGLLPPETQVLFLSQIMHTYLADPQFKINLEADFDIGYPEERQSFFTYHPSDTKLTPKDASKHESLNTTQFLSKRLRWLTLGAQYHWPTRSYPTDTSQSFPPDIAKLVQGLFSHIRPESGVCLLYGAKDYMPVHRDVSEQCDKALASFSLGCDGIFVVGRGETETDDPEERRRRTVAIRVRSGDCIHLDGETRWAWHAMPRTIAGTCPEFLAGWPVGTPGATEEERRAFERWEGWMGRKRLNVSCRQVWD